jgi:hypothetical protein
MTSAKQAGREHSHTNEIASAGLRPIRSTARSRASFPRRKRSSLSRSLRLSMCRHRRTCPSAPPSEPGSRPRRYGSARARGSDAGKRRAPPRCPAAHPLTSRASAHDHIGRPFSYEVLHTRAGMGLRAISICVPFPLAEAALRADQPEASFSLSARSVRGPRTPSACRPLACWNRFSAATVAGP